MLLSCDHTSRISQRASLSIALQHFTPISSPGYHNRPPRDDIALSRTNELLAAAQQTIGEHRDEITSLKNRLHKIQGEFQHEYAERLKLANAVCFAQEKAAKAAEAAEADRLLLQAKLVQTNQALDSATDELKSLEARQAKIEDEASLTKRQLAEALDTIAEQQKAIASFEDQLRESRDREVVCATCVRLEDFNTKKHHAAVVDLRDSVSKDPDWTGGTGGSPQFASAVRTNANTDSAIEDSVANGARLAECSTSTRAQRTVGTN